MEGLVTGIAVGCLIGVITGMMTLLILRDAFPTQTRALSFMERIFGRRQASGIRLAGKISTLPVFWFGSPWLTTIVMNDLSWTDLRSPYLVTLAVIFVLITVVPLVRLIAHVARKMQ